MDKLGRADQGHLQFIRRHGNQLTGDCFCGACGNLFTRPVDLFRHLAGKTRNKNEIEFAVHASFFVAVVLPFVGMNVENLFYRIGSVLSKMALNVPKTCKLIQAF